MAKHLKTPPVEAPKKLSPAHLHALNHSDAELRLAATLVQLAHERSRVAALTHENEVMRSRIKSEDATKTLTEQMTAAVAQQSQAGLNQINLAKELGALYDVDLASCSYNQLTGDLHKEQG